MKRSWILLTIVLLSVATLTAQSKKEKKKQAAAEEYERIQKLIESKSYVFEADWADTFSGKRINMTTNANYLKIMKDSADIFLPYFGVGHANNNYKSGEGGVTFKGVLEEYDVTVNEKKQTHTIKFKARNKIELFEFSLLVYKSGNSTVNVNSSGRSGIRYDGKTMAPKK